MVRPTSDDLSKKWNALTPEQRTAIQDQASYCGRGWGRHGRGQGRGYGRGGGWGNGNW